MDNNKKLNEFLNFLKKNMDEGPSEEEAGAKDMAEIMKKLGGVNIGGMGAMKIESLKDVEKVMKKIKEMVEDEDEDETIEIEKFKKKHKSWKTGDAIQFKLERGSKSREVKDAKLFIASGGQWVLMNDEASTCPYPSQLGYAHSVALTRDIDFKFVTNLKLAKKTLYNLAPHDYVVSPDGIQKIVGINYSNKANPIYFLSPAKPEADFDEDDEDFKNTETFCSAFDLDDMDYEVYKVK